jgi:hypothetical protein
MSNSGSAVDRQLRNSLGSEMERVALETRWIVLGTDGRHVTLGRHSDPSPEEISEAERGLAAQGLSGWLALMKGGYYVRLEPSLMMVRPLANPTRQFEEAAADFETKRKATLDSVPG